MPSYGLKTFKNQSTINQTLTKLGSKIFKNRTLKLTWGHRYPKTAPRANKTPKRWFAGAPGTPTGGEPRVERGPKGTQGPWCRGERRMSEWGSYFDFSPPHSLSLSLSLSLSFSLCHSFLSTYVVFLIVFSLSLFPLLLLLWYSIEDSEGLLLRKVMDKEEEEDSREESEGFLLRI